MDPALSSHLSDERKTFLQALLAQSLQSGERLMSESSATLREVCERQNACVKAVCASNLESTVQIANLWLNSEVRVICSVIYASIPIYHVWCGVLSSSWGGVV